MKYSFAIAALVGYTQGYKLSPLGHEGRLQVLNEMIYLSEDKNEAILRGEIDTPTPDDDEAASDDDGRFVQVRGDYDEVPAYLDGAEAFGGYTRVVPAKFGEERDDRLMNSMIKNYAREIKKAGELTGHFFLNREDARAASNEVLKTHSRANAVGSDQFEAVWNHFDVNHDGLVEVERMPQFFRMLLGNALDIDL